MPSPQGYLLNSTGKATYLEDKFQMIKLSIHETQHHANKPLDS